MYNLEFALLADGVQVEGVYSVLNTPQGVDRTFAKLTALKPYPMVGGRRATRASWQPPRAGLTGQSVWHGLPGDHQRLEHVDQAKRFIAFANQPDAQVRYVEQIPYGPTNTEAAARLDSKLAQWVSAAPQNVKGALSMDVAFWVDHGEEIEERFNAGLASNHSRLDVSKRPARTVDFFVTLLR